MKFSKTFKKLLSFLLCLILPVSIGVHAEKTVSSECDISDINEPIAAVSTNAAIGAKLSIGAKSAILLEPNTGEILYEMNSSEKLPPASITKIMSLLLIMEEIDGGRLSLEDVVTASSHAASMGGSQIWLKENESMTVDDLLKATVIASANDATVALGEHIAGSEEGFVAMMNERARQLGMNNTTFINSTGLDAEGHITTAHDVALMSAALIKHPLIKRYSTVWMDSLRDGQSELVNTNKLVRFYEGTTGLKTGTTSGAGYCLSATAQREGTEFVAVIMGGNSSNERFEGAKKLLDYGFKNFTYKKITPSFDKNTYAALSGGTQKGVGIEIQGDFGVLLKKGQTDVTQKLNLDKDLTAPVKKGESVGKLEIYSQDEHIGSFDVVAAESVAKISLGVTFKWLLAGLFIP